MHKSFIEPRLGQLMSSEQKAIQGYCVKCRKKQNFVNPEKTTLKNGKPATKGKCGICGTNMFRIGKS